MTWRSYVVYRLWELRYYLVEALKGSNTELLWLTAILYGLIGVLAAYKLAVALGSWRRPRDPPRHHGPLPTVSVVVPCYNEELCIRRNVAAVAALDYPAHKLDVIYVYDRGDDATPEILHALAERHPIRVVENTSGDHSKAGAINHAVREFATGDVIAVYDADTSPDAGNVRRAVDWLMADDSLGLVNGRRRIINARENLLTRLVSVEYHCLYRVEHYGRPSLGGVALFYGSNGFFRREAVEALGGFDSRMLTEDIDMGFRLLEAGYRVQYDPQLEEFDEAPPTLAAWWRQRLRWSRGWLQVLRRHLGRVHRMRGGVRERGSAALMLLAVPAPLVLMLAWLLVLPYVFVPEYRAVFVGRQPLTSVFWLVTWSTPIAYFMSGWFHDYRQGERRWGDLALILPLVPLVAYFTLHSFVLWHALLETVKGKKAVWTKTERSRRAGGQAG